MFTTYYDMRGIIICKSASRGAINQQPTNPYPALNSIFCLEVSALLLQFIIKSYMVQYGPLVSPVRYDPFFKEYFCWMNYQFCFGMNGQVFFLNGYFLEWILTASFSRSGCEIMDFDIELNLFWARFNVWMNNQNVSNRATTGSCVKCAVLVMTCVTQGPTSALMYEYKLRSFELKVLQGHTHRHTVTFDLLGEP